MPAATIHEPGGDLTTVDMGAVRLSCLPVGRCGMVVAVEGGGLMRRRLLDLGFVPGTRVEVVRRSPAGDPTAFSIRGALIALRGETARQILVLMESGEGGENPSDFDKSGIRRRRL